MRSARGLIALCLVAALASPPASLAGVPAIGIVLQASNARVGTAAAANGATVFPGSELATEKTGSLRVRVMSTLIYLSPESSALVVEDSGKTGISVERGTMGFVLAAADDARPRVGELEFRAASGAAHGQVRRLSDNEVLVACLSGNLLAAVDDESVAIPAGSTLHLRLEQQQVPAPAGTAKGAKPKPQKPQSGGSSTPNPAGAGADKTHRITILKITIGAAIIGGIIAAVILANTREPASP